MASLDPAKQEKISAALLSMDMTDDNLWTDDGLPKVQIVAKLIGDDNLRRQEINEAVPGFARKVPGTTETANGLEPSADGGTVLSPGEDTSGEKATAEGMGGAPQDRQAYLRQAVKDAEASYLMNQKVLSDAHSAAPKLRAAIERARKNYHAAFPILTEAQNIKNHLRSEHQKALNAALGRAPLRPGEMPAPNSSLDAALSFRPRGNQRGGSPIRAVKGPDGQLHMPVNRKSLTVPGGPNIGLGAVPQG